MNTDKHIMPPISIDKVADALGTSADEVASLCRSSAINAKSAKKPIRYIQSGDVDNYPRILSDSAFMTANYGVKINTYTNMEEMVAKLDVALSGDGKDDMKAFYYEAPKDGDMCRLTDFEGYNANAFDWCTIDIVNHGLATATDATNYAKIVVRFGEALSSFQSLQMWGAFQRYWGYLRFALLIKSANGVFLLPLLSNEAFVQYSGDYIAFKPNIVGECQVYPVLTTVRSVADGAMAPMQSLPKGDSASLYIPMPYSSYTKWRPVASGTPEGGLPPTAESVELRLLGHSTVNLGDGYYIVNAFGLVVESNGKDVEVTIYAGTQGLDKVYLGTWEVVDDLISYQRQPDKEPDEVMRFKSEDNQPKLRVYYKKVNATESKKIIDL